MKKSITVAVIAVLAATLSACSSETSPTEENCKIGHINDVAMKHGLEKAAQLSENCIKKGYDDSVQWLNKQKEQAEDLGDDIKNKGEKFADDVKDKGEKIGNDIKNKSEQLRNKGEDLKNKVVDFSNETVEKGKNLIK